MSTRYVWERYDDEYTLVRSSIANNTILKITASGNREIHYTTEDVSRPRYSSVSGEFALRKEGASWHLQNWAPRPPAASSS